MRQFVCDNYDLTPRGIIKALGLLNVDCNMVSSYGHFGKPGLSWERCKHVEKEKSASPSE